MAKICIICFHVNNKDLMFLQNYALKKYLTDENIVYNVVIDAIENDTMKNAAENVYDKNRIFFVPQNLHNERGHNASARNCTSVNWAFQNIAVSFLKENENSYVLLLDGDCFPIKNISLSSLCENNCITSLKQQRYLNGKNEAPTVYCWIGFVIVSSKSPFFHTLDFSLAPGLDAGGMTSKYLSEIQPSVKWIEFRYLNLSDFDGIFDADIALLYETQTQNVRVGPEFLANAFYHMRSMTCNWKNISAEIVAKRITAMEMAVRTYVKN